MAKTQSAHRAPETIIVAEDQVIAAATNVLLEHFNERWGQGAPLTRAEAILVANQFWRCVQGPAPI